MTGIDVQSHASQPEAVATLEVEIWSDVVCPWCYIGKRKFESALESFSEAHPEVSVVVAYRAFQLDPTAPPGVSQLVAEAYAKKFGGKEKAEQILRTVTEAAAEVGIAFDMANAKRANTLLAHRLLVLAESQGKQLVLKERLMKAYFCEGRAIGDTEVLVELAVDVGLDEAEATAWLDSRSGSLEVASQLEAAAELGINSVPTVVFNRSFGVPGAQDPEYYVRVLEKLSSRLT